MNGNIIMYTQSISFALTLTLSVLSANIGMFIYAWSMYIITYIVLCQTGIFLLILLSFFYRFLYYFDNNYWSYSPQSLTHFFILLSLSYFFCICISLIISEGIFLSFFLSINSSIFFFSHSTLSSLYPALSQEYFKYYLI